MAEGDILSQKFVHKYGFDVPAEEWNERTADGQSVVTLKDGVTVTRTYENGQLHGPTTYTFPHSSIIEKLQIFDQGVLLKEIAHDASGVPVREEAYEFDDRKVVTLWDQKGIPLSIEEYEGSKLNEGQYFSPDHELEGQVVAGFGERVKRDRAGQLIARDVIQGGVVASRTSYHPNGQIHTISHYKEYALDGEQLKFSPSGKPLLKLSWSHGLLDGPKVVYRNGLKVAEIPYKQGEKHGTELHFDDLGNLTAEIEWSHDKKHGPSKFHAEEGADLEWFYRGQAVTSQKFQLLTEREAVAADLEGHIDAVDNAPVR
jgi:antitoxin component YwqK of YwqJK toxin-antitoxin module